jgi:hypothetical protein
MSEKTVLDELKLLNSNVAVIASKLGDCALALGEIAKIKREYSEKMRREEAELGKASAAKKGGKLVDPPDGLFKPYASGKGEWTFANLAEAAPIVDRFLADDAPPFVETEKYRYKLSANKRFLARYPK